MDRLSRADGNARRCGYSMQNLQPRSPSSNGTSSFIADSASSPLAIRMTWSPCSAPRVRTERMDFPLAVLSFFASVIWLCNPFACCTKTAAGRACNPDLLPSVTVRSIMSYFQNKENIASGPHCTTGTAHDCPTARGNDRTDHHLTQTLDDGAVKADDGSSGLDFLAFHSDVAETLTFQLDGIQPKMDDQFDAATCSDTKGVSTRKQFDQRACYRRY